METRNMANVRRFAAAFSALLCGVGLVSAESLEVLTGTRTLTQEPNTTARYLRVKCTKTYPWDTTNANGTWGLSFFGVTRDGELVSYPAAAKAAGSDGSNAAAVLSPTRGGGEAYNWQAVLGTDLTIDMGEPVTFNGYSWGQPWVAPGRAPYDFTVEISSDGKEWFLWDERKGAVSSNWGTSDGVSDYSPRMDPQPVANALPIFDADDTVAIAKGATLELDHVNGRVPNLSGAGVLRIEGGHVILTGNCTFTGVIDGWGWIDLAMENDTLGFTCANTAFVVRNMGKPRTWRLSGRLPETRDDEEAPLSLVLSGDVQRLAVPRKMVTAYGEEIAPMALHGSITFDDATVTTCAGAPRLARFLRYVSTKGFSSVHMVGEVELRLGGVRQEIPASAYSWQNWFATTNFTQRLITAHQAWEGRKCDRLAYLTDGNPDTYWQKSSIGDKTANEPYAQVELPYPIPFDSVAVFAPSTGSVDNGAYLAQRWEIETSADGWTWTRVQTQDIDYDYGPWPYKRGELRDDAVEESSVWPKAGVNVVRGSSSVANALQYLRMTIYGLSGAKGENTGNFTSFGEMQLYRGGVWQPWPAGTTAKWLHGVADKSITNICNSTGEFVAKAWNSYEDNQKNDQGGEAQYTWPGGADGVSQGVGFVVKASEDLPLDAYALYMGGQWEANNRVPNIWTLDASYDGITWATIDSCANGYEVFTALNESWRYMWDHRFFLRTVDTRQLSGKGLTDGLGDAATVTVSAGATLNIHSAQETVGRLEGAGTVSLSGYSPVLTLKGLDFSGAMTGSGELVLEAGLHHFSDADLSGVRKITVRAGAVVTGRALLGGNDLEVVSEGGAWAAEYAGIGVFKLVGEPLAMPLLEPDNAKKVVRKCFAYAETDAASKALFLASTTAGWPAVSRLSLKANDHAMSFKATSSGMVIVIQ